MSVRDSQSNNVLCQTSCEMNVVPKYECVKSVPINVNVDSNNSDVPEVSEHIDIQNITKKSENSKSGGASVSRFADILQTSSGHTKKGNLKLKKTERGKFTIAKGSPVSAKKNQKSSKKSSGLTVPNIVRFPTNQKAANIGNFTHSNLVTNRNESVGQITPSKRKLMGVRGGGMSGC